MREITFAVDRIEGDTVWVFVTDSLDKKRWDLMGLKADECITVTLPAVTFSEE